MVAEPAHRERQVDGGGHVETQRGEQRDFEDGDASGEEDKTDSRAEHGQNRSEPLARHERPRGIAAERLSQHARTAGDEDERQPEREEAAHGSLDTPADAEADGVEDDDAAHHQQHRGGDQIGRPHYFFRSPPFAIRSLCICSALSTHFVYSAPVANAGLSAFLCMYSWKSGVSYTFLRKALYQSAASFGIPGAPKIPRSIWYWMSVPRASFAVGMSFHSASGMRSGSKTASGRTRPAFQWLTHSAGLFTVESTCLPTRLTHTSPPPLNGTYVNLRLSACSSWTVMIWSSCFDPVPPIEHCPPSRSLHCLLLTASRYSRADLYGVSLFTHRMNRSRAMRATGVRSFRLKGVPCASGVVNRFDSVMMIVCASPFLPLT